MNPRDRYPQQGHWNANRQSWYQNTPRRGRTSHSRFVLVVLTFIIIVAAIVVISTVARHTNAQTVTCTVTGKDHTIDKDNDPVYRVYTSGGSDCTTFDIADSAIFSNFNSADLYGRLQEGKTYRLDTTGYRNGFFSMFPVIRSASEVSK